MSSKYGTEAAHRFVQDTFFAKAESYAGSQTKKGSDFVARLTLLDCAGHTLYTKIRLFYAVSHRRETGLIVRTFLVSFWLSSVCAADIEHKSKICDSIWG